MVTVFGNAALALDHYIPSPRFSSAAIGHPGAAWETVGGEIDLQIAPVSCRSLPEHLVRDHAAHVVRERVPQGHCFHLIQSSDQEPEKASVAGLGVDALRRRRTLLVNPFGTGRLH